MRLTSFSLITFGFVLVAASLSHAAPRCAEVWEVGPTVWEGRAISAKYNPSEVSVRQLEGFDEVVGSVNAFLGDLKRPARPVVLVDKSNLGPFANSLDKTISIGPRFGATVKGSSKIFYFPPQYSKTIQAHEYGHLIFDANFSLREPLWNEGLDAWRQLQAQTADLRARGGVIDDRLTELRKISPSTPETEAEIKTLEAEETSLRDQYSKLKDKIYGPYEFVQELTSPFNEFFGDVVGVLYAGKKDVIERALVPTRRLQTGDKEALRAKIMWRSFYRNPPGHPSPVEMKAVEETHIFLGRARNFLWRNYLAAPTNLEHRREAILSGVFEAVVAEIERLKALPTFAYDQAHWDDINSRFEQRIAKELLARGIEPLK